MMRKVSCNDLYSMTPEAIEKGILGLDGCYYTHIPEISSYDLKETQADRIETRVLKFVDFDGRRIWRLATVWFDNLPVMVIQNAGREGDDHAKRFVTDWDRYRRMVTYLAEIARYGDTSPNTETIDPNEQRDDLLWFYYEHFDTVASER